MEGKQELRPPYATSGQIQKLLDLLGRMNPKEINANWIVSNELATASNAFRILDFLRWMDFVDTNGEINEEKLRKLKLVGPEKEGFLQSQIKESYKDLFERYDLEKATRADIINYFINSYKFGSAQAQAAARLVLHLCQKYEIPLSEDLRKVNYISSSNTLRRKRTKKPKNTESKGQGQDSSPKEGVEIKITGHGIIFKLQAKNQEELEEIIKNKLPSIFPAVKVLLPKKEVLGEDAEH